MTASPDNVPGRPVDEVAVAFTGVGKTYPGTRALADVSLQIHRGEVHALVGENGSGKSTLIGILGGKTVADPGGRVEVYGAELHQGDPAHAGRLGVSVIHQELMIVPQISALENVFLGDLPTRAGVVATQRMREGFDALQAELGTDIDPGRAAGLLSVAQQTMLEIMRAVRKDVRVLVLDEPSATLGIPDRERLYALIDRLRGRGVTCVLISHDLEEVLRMADRVTVLRDGVHVRTAERAAWTKDGIVQEMLGEERAALAFDGSASRRKGPRGEDAPPALEVQGLRCGRVAIDRLTVGRGEIVGLAGLVGSGRSTLLLAIAGVHHPRAGTMSLDGSAVAWPRTPADAVRAGIALMPEDRKDDGLVLGMPSYDNVTLTDFGAVARWGLLRRRRSKARAASLLEDLAFRGRIEHPTQSLSGGNQQKVLMAKWLHRPPSVLLIDEPTRGVDIGAKADVITAVEALADRGHAVLWASSELDEVVAVSDRVLVMAGGRIVDELDGERISVATTLDRIFAAVGAGDDHDARPVGAGAGGMA